MAGVTFGGSPFCLDDQEIHDWLGESIPLDQMQALGMSRTWPGTNLTGISWNYFTPQSPASWLPRIGEWIYPFGACRYSCYATLLHQDEYNVMVPLSYTDSGPVAQTFTMEGNDATITTQMYLLPPRPLAQFTSENLYLAVLVDERFFWNNNPVTLTITNTSTWNEIIEDLAAVLGITINYTSPIEAVYGQPSEASDLNAKAENAAILLDACLMSVGRTLIRNLDGTYTAAKFVESQAISEDNYSNLKQAGGDSTDLLLTNNNDNLTPEVLLPSDVVVTFPKKVIGNGYININYGSIPYQKTTGDLQGYTVTLADAGFDQYAGNGRTKCFHNTAIAYFATDNDLTPKNDAQLNALATQIATDYFNTFTDGLDIVYPGVFDWVPEGIHVIRWTWTGKGEDGKQQTRISIMPWDYTFEEMLNSFSKGTSGESYAIFNCSGSSICDWWTNSGVLRSYFRSYFTCLGNSETDWLYPLIQWNTSGTSQCTWWDTGSSGSIIPYPITVPHGGTDRTSLTQYEVLAGDGISPIFSIPNNTSGFILVSNGASMFPSFQSTSGLAYPLPWTVPQGGTGDTFLTAYEVLAGGTTDTNPLQSIPNNTSGYILTSNGTGALPTFQVPAPGTSLYIGEPITGGNADGSLLYDSTSAELAEATAGDLTYNNSTHVLNVNPGSVQTYNVGAGNTIAGTNCMAVGTSNTLSANYVNAFGLNNNNSAGGFSTLAGYNNKTSAARTTAIGNTNTASGAYATSIGSTNTASASKSTACGYKSITSGTNSVSAGYKCTVSGNTGVAVGSTCTAGTGIQATAMGVACTASGIQSSAAGYHNTCAGNYSMAFGSTNKTPAASSIAIGYNNDTTGGIDGICIGNTCLASALGAISMGNSCNASNTAASAIGYKAAASGVNSVAAGYLAVASAMNANVFGNGLTNAVANTTLLGNATGNINITNTGIIPSVPWFSPLSNPGQTVVVTIPKLTLAGANGSITFEGGVCTAFVQPT